MTPPGWRRGGTKTGFRGALLPGLSSICCIFDGGVHTDAIASKAPKGTQKENRKGKKSERKKKK